MKNLLSRRKLAKSGAFALAAGLALTFTACASASSVDDDPTAEDQATEAEGIQSLVPEHYLDEGIEVAAYNDWAPAEFVNEEGELVGWSIDFAHELADILGVDITITGTTFDAIIPGLKSENFDAGFASFGPTEERLQILDMVAEVVDGTGYASLEENNFEVSSIEDLCGHSVAVIVGAFDFQYLTEQNEEVCQAKGLEGIVLEQYDTQSNAQLGVISGRVDFVAAGSQKLQYWAERQGDVVVSELISNPVYNSIGVRRGDPLGEALTAAMQKLIDSGKYEEILSEWGITTGLLDEAVLITSENPNPPLPGE